MCCCERDYEAEREAETQTNTVRVLAALMGLSDVTEHTYRYMYTEREVANLISMWGPTTHPERGSLRNAGLTFQVHGRWGWLAADGTLNAHGNTLDTEAEAEAELIAYMTGKES